MKIEERKPCQSRNTDTGRYLKLGNSLLHTTESVHPACMPHVPVNAAFQHPCPPIPSSNCFQVVRILRGASRPLQSHTASREHARDIDVASRSRRNDLIHRGSWIE